MFVCLGEYDKLWQAVSSGKGKRGGKKRTAAKQVEGDFLKFGMEILPFFFLTAEV